MLVVLIIVPSHKSLLKTELPDQDLPLKVYDGGLPLINFITDTQYVVPAGIAGIQKPRMARIESSNHILVTWIPAVHAGMTCYFMGMNKFDDGGTHDHHIKRRVARFLQPI